MQLEPSRPELRRVIDLPLLVLYGLGITIGAGIYVLIGEAAAVASVYAPSAFLVAAAVMSFSALSLGCAGYVAELIPSTEPVIGAISCLFLLIGPIWLS